jgi:hypothetical protein
MEEMMLNKKEARLDKEGMSVRRRRLLNENNLRLNQKINKDKQIWEDGSEFPEPQKGKTFTDGATKKTAMKLLGLVRTFAFGFMTDGESDPFAEMAKQGKDVKGYCKSDEGKAKMKDKDQNLKAPFCDDSRLKEWSGESESDNKDADIPKMLGEEGWIKKNSKEIAKIGVLKKMGDDFKASFGMKKGLDGKKQVGTMTGSDFAQIQDGFGKIEQAPEVYAEKFLVNMMKKRTRAIWKGAPPICEYQFTITLDFESSPPGFCTPSTSMFTVTGTMNWRGTTADTAAFNFKTRYGDRTGGGGGGEKAEREWRDGGR